MRDAMEARIAELERRLVELRREITPQAEAFPSEPAHYLEVLVGAGRYLVPVAAVREVLPAVWPTPLPDAPRWVRGTMRYGELVVPMIDLEHRLYGVERALALEDVLVLVETPRWVALLARGVRHVLWIEPRDLSPLAPGIPQAPFLLATRSTEDGDTAHVVSVSRLGRDVLIDDTH